HAAASNSSAGAANAIGSINPSDHAQAQATASGASAQRRVAGGQSRAVERKRADQGDRNGIEAGAGTQSAKCKRTGLPNRAFQATMPHTAAQCRLVYPADSSSVRTLEQK
ncbi:MAG: hypothetical protein ACN6PE_04790, partial [Achromobacter marplatensis]|uniref:hypothetical protein n=1 Tax=Achromobacter marplatensis TaxID=470868 RepID=UPI003CFFCDC2